MTRSLIAVATALTLSSATGCGPAARAARPAGLRSPTLVEVKNTSWFDVVVYNLRSGTRWRLGTVTSMGTEVFRVSRADLTGAGELRLVADPIGSPEAFVSDRIMLSPGDLVELTIAPRLAQSYFAVRD